LPRYNVKFLHKAQQLAKLQEAGILTILRVPDVVALTGD
jgi:hypothetical protein